MIYDAVIIGAATSGAYFARKMAKKGYKVKMLERLSAEKLGTRMDIFHVSHSDFRKFDMPEVKQGDREWAFEFTDNHFSSPTSRYAVATTCETVGLHMHEYVALMVKLALEAGAEIEYSASFSGFLLENGVICGVKYETADGQKEIRAKTVIDCSGSSAVARCALPENYGVETFKLADEDMFYVVLRYAKFTKEQINTFWLNFKSWFAPFSMNGSEKIIGTGAVRSFENCEKTIEKLDKVCTEDEFEVVRTEKGTTPFRRPPYSLVADNFIVTGDAACLTKPDCGEGVTSSMVMMDIAAEVLDAALKNGRTDKAALWKINTEYNRAQGADFCFTRAFLTKVIKATDDEMEYCFAKKLIFNEKFLDNGKIGAGDILKTVGGIAGGLVKKKISAATLGGVISGAKLGISLKSHYLKFPQTPDGFDKWVKKSDKLWQKVGKVE